MIRVLGGAAWCCSVLAVVCLVLGVLAAPVGVAKADEPGSGGEQVSCGNHTNPGFCQGVQQASCDPTVLPNCNSHTECACKYNETFSTCGCYPK